jgi:hypothetical protein
MHRNKKKAKFGVKWWDRFGHVTVTYPGHPSQTFSTDEFDVIFAWPVICKECAALI